MTAPSTLTRPDPTAARRALRTGRPPAEAVEDPPSVQARLVWLAARLTIRPVLTVGAALPTLPWPFGLVDAAVGVLAPVRGGEHATIRLRHCTAALVRAAGVLPADGTRRVVLYLHGGAFLVGGANTHGRLVNRLSRYADSPVLIAEYRMVPRHSVDDAIDDCHDAYRWLRGQGYRPEQIVLAGDSAGGYLTLALAERLVSAGERPAAIVAMSPLLEVAPEPKQQHRDLGSGAMFPARAFEALRRLVTDASRRDRGHGHPGRVLEPLQHVRPGLPPMLIHVSGAEVLLHDARLAARLLAAAGVPVQVRVWPGQIHVFQIAAPFVPEATRSLRQIGEYIRRVTG